jgi:hypothetical protein
MSTLIVPLRQDKAILLRELLQHRLPALDAIIANASVNQLEFLRQKHQNLWHGSG